MPISRNKPTLREALSASTEKIMPQLGSPDGIATLANSWPRTRCLICGKTASGIWLLQFDNNPSQLVPLCAPCGLTDCYQKYTGFFFTPHLIRCDLFLTITAPPGDKRTNADRLTEKIREHPMGEKWLSAWRIMFKPANPSYPIKPALDMLVTIHNRLFPHPYADALQGPKPLTPIIET